MTFLLFLFLLGLWRDWSEHPGNSIGDETAPTQSRRGSRLATLTGVYESGRPPAVSRLCIVPQGRNARFGLVIREAGDQSCSGSGTVTRDGGGLRFAMTGDSPCAVHAKIAGRTLIFDTRVPAGCTYYCGAGARLGGARLMQRSTRRSEAMKATDLVGEPLCAEG